MKLNYTQTTEYKAILQDYINGLRKLADFRNWDTKKEVMNAEMNKRHINLTQKYNTYLEGKRVELERERSEISRRIKNTKEIYNDPQLEILRRQDFDLEFETWNKSDTLAILRDGERDLSSYELAKIKNKFKNDTDILGEIYKREQSVNDLLENTEYRQVEEELQVLNLIRSGGLGTAYLPQAEGSEKDYEMYDLSLSGTLPFTDINGRIEEMKTILSVIGKQQKKDGYESLKKELGIQKKAEKKHEYKDFDSRIFKNSPTYDITDRFKYLKERFDDTSTDFWDFRRDGYDPIAHLNFLEKRHDDYMENNPNYAEKYREVETLLRKEVAKLKSNGTQYHSEQDNSEAVID